MWICAADRDLSLLDMVALGGRFLFPTSGSCFLEYCSLWICAANRDLSLLVMVALGGRFLFLNSGSYVDLCSWQRSISSGHGCSLWQVSVSYQWQLCGFVQLPEIYSFWIWLLLVAGFCFLPVAVMWICAADRDLSLLDMVALGGRFLFPTSGSYVDLCNCHRKSIPSGCGCSLWPVSISYQWQLCSRILFSLRLLPRFSKLCLTPTSSNILNLTIFFPITSMASVRQDLQGIFFPVLLIPGHPLLGNFGESLVVALDISKAFDRVWHKALLAKIPAYGFTPSFCKLISGFLSYRFISVIVDGATSASFPVSSGVPQGSVFSPTLFLLIIIITFQTANPNW